MIDIHVYSSLPTVVYVLHQAAVTTTINFRGVLMDEVKDWINKLDERHCDWLLSELDRNIAPIPPDANISSIRKKREVLLSAIEKKHPYRDEFSMKKHIEKLHNNLLDINLFSWIDNKNIRQCTWLFNELDLFHVPKFHYIKPPCNILQFSHFKSLVIYDFDNMHRDRRDKQDDLSRLEEDWRIINNEPELFKWLKKKDFKQCEWALSYIRKNHRISRHIFPTTAEEIHGTVIGQVDFNHCHRAEKQLLSEKMNRAWSQKKHRDSLNGKKSYNIVMSITVKKMLDDIAKNDGRHINETLEALISDKFKNL